MESHWLEGCKTGDEAAIERFVAAYQPQVYRLAYSILADPAEAEDATQETFLACLRALDSFRGESSFKTWVYTIAINTCRNRWQRAQTRQRVQNILQTVFHTQGRETHPEEQAIQQEADSALWNAVRGLDEKHRLPVILRYYHDLPIADIAVLLHVPQGTIHSRLNIARERLRNVLKEAQL